MNSVLDTTLASSIEGELAAIGSRSSRLQERQRRMRTVAVAAGGLVLAGALTGAGIIAEGWPGERTITPIGGVVASGTYVGDAELEVGTPPADAAFLVLDISCDSGGEMYVETGTSANDTGASWNCGDGLFDGKTRIEDGRLPAPGDTSIVIKAESGTEWSVNARFATSSSTPLGVNAKGETFGVDEDTGIAPNLMPARATNGRLGYIYTEDGKAFTAGEEGFIPVYLSDGETVIGEFPNCSDC